MTVLRLRVELPDGGFCTVAVDGDTALASLGSRPIDLDAERALSRLSSQAPWPVVVVDAVRLIQEAYGDSPPKGWDSPRSWRRAAEMVEGVLAGGSGVKDDVGMHPAAALWAVHPDDRVFKLVGANDSDMRAPLLKAAIRSQLSRIQETESPWW